LRKARSDNIPRNCCPKLPPKTPRVVIAGVQEPWYIFAVWSAAASLDEKGRRGRTSSDIGTSLR
jgi:hypothetical protein